MQGNFIAKKLQKTKILCKSVKNYNRELNIKMDWLGYERKEWYNKEDINISEITNIIFKECN